MSQTLTGTWVDTSNFTVEIGPSYDDGQRYDASCDDPACGWSSPAIIEPHEVDGKPTVTCTFVGINDGVRTDLGAYVNDDGTQLQWNNGVIWNKQ